MRTEYIDVYGYWGVIVCYDYDMNDWDDIWSICRSFGMPDAKAREAIRVLEQPNTGMAVSNDDIRMSAVFISDATSASEFYSTAIHEMIHVADAILDYYGTAWDGEPSAYLVGYLTKELVEMVGEPCTECR